MDFDTLLQLAHERGIIEMDVYGIGSQDTAKEAKFLSFLNDGNVNFDCLSGTNNSSITCDVIWILFSIFIN